MHDNFSFELSRFPRIVYGVGVINVLSEMVKDYADIGRLMTRQSGYPCRKLISV